MNCHEAAIYFDEYLIGQLNAHDKARLEGHLNSCAGCREELEETRRLSQMLQSDKVPDPGDPYWSDLENTIISKTLEAPRSTDISGNSIDFRKGQSLLGYLFPLAASLLLLIISFTGTTQITGLRTEKMTASVSTDIRPEIRSVLFPDGNFRTELLGSAMLAAPGSLAYHAMTIRLVNSARTGGNDL
jgi:hypothetical protein